MDADRCGGTCAKDSGRAVFARARNAVRNPHDVLFGDGAAEATRETKESLWDSVSAWILARIPGYACWSSGGLETQLFALFCTLSLGRYLQAILDEENGNRAPLWQIGITLGLAALTRPEGYLLFALLALHRIILKIKKRDLIPTKRGMSAASDVPALHRRT